MDLLTIESPGKGRGLALSASADKYALIRTEQADLAVLQQECLTTHCSYCLRAPDKFKLKKCASCQAIYYCSEKCQRRDWDLHKGECQLLKILPQLPFPLMRLHARALNKMRLSLDFASQLMGLVDNLEQFPADMKDHFGQWGAMVTQLIPFAIPEGLTAEDHIRISCILKTNAFTPTNELGHTFGLLLFGRLAQVNHSCSPNAEYACIDRKMRLVTLRPIERGEEILISYIDRFQPKAARQAELQRHFHFTCECCACLAQSNQAADPQGHANEAVEPRRHASEAVEPQGHVSESVGPQGHASESGPLAASMDTLEQCRDPFAWACLAKGVAERLVHSQETLTQTDARLYLTELFTSGLGWRFDVPDLKVQVDLLMAAAICAVKTLDISLATQIEAKLNQHMALLYGHSHALKV